jgi:hypothetical protein
MFSRHIRVSVAAVAAVGVMLAAGIVIPSHELGAQSFDEHARDHVQRRLVYRLERLGFAVTLEALPALS